MDIGEKIKLRRCELNLSQKDLSAKSNIPYRTIQQYEAGKFKPKAENLNKLLDALELPKLSFSNLDELLKYDDNSILTLSDGDKLLALRYCVGMSRAELGMKAGIDANLIEEYECQKKFPSFEMLYKISCILKVPAYWMTGIKIEIISNSDTETEDNEKKRILEAIYSKLIEDQYSSSELKQILEYMIFISSKRGFDYISNIDEYNN